MMAEMTPRGLLGVCLALVACSAPPREARGASPPPLAPAEVAAAADPGPRIGEPIPAFELPDQDGRPHTFESLRGPKGLVLNFNRSVVW